MVEMVAKGIITAVLEQQVLPEHQTQVAAVALVLEVASSADLADLV